MDDLISRKAAIAELDHAAWGKEYDKALAKAMLESLPSVQPKNGKWILLETAYEDTEAKCSICGFYTLVNEPGNGLHMVDDLNYCPHCGAFMRGDTDD